MSPALATISRGTYNWTLFLVPLKSLLYTNRISDRSGVHPPQLLGWSWNPHRRAKTCPGKFLHPNRPLNDWVIYPEPQLQGTPEPGSLPKAWRQKSMSWVQVCQLDTLFEHVSVLREELTGRVVFRNTSGRLMCSIMHWHRMSNSSALSPCKGLVS